ncbi:unnamed protein product, partial [Didymodactylos carnosus]
HMMITRISLIIPILTGLIFPSATKPVDSEDDALDYLNRFGYSSCNASLPVQCSENFASMLIEFQRYFGLNMTGVVDKETQTIMNLPRCSVVDKPNENILQRISNKTWSRLSLTYRLESHAHFHQISYANQISIVQDAFNEWSKYTPLTFEMVCNTCLSDIVLQFVEGDHGDGAPFDEKTLAHAFLPTDGRIHLDSQDTWTELYNSTSKTVINLFLVTMHEIGHALGLEHVKNRQSIMFPTYQLKQRSDVLTSIDQQSIQALYGKKAEADCTTPRTSTPTAIAMCTKTVLLLSDDNTVANDALAAQLRSSGMTVRTINNGILTYLGTPEPTTFDVIVLITGNKYNADMPLAGQMAIVNAQKIGTSVVMTEWAALHVSDKRWQILASLVLLSRVGNGVSSVLTFNLTETKHSIWTGLPNAFRTVHRMSANTGELINNGTMIARCQECGRNQIGVAVRENLGEGRIVHVAHAGHYSGSRGTFSWSNNSDPYLSQMMVNAVNWAIICV